VQFHYCIRLKAGRHRPGQALVVLPGVGLARARPAPKDLIAKNCPLRRWGMSIPANAPFSQGHPSMAPQRSVRSVSRRSPHPILPRFGVVLRSTSGQKSGYQRFGRISITGDVFLSSSFLRLGAFLGFSCGFTRGGPRTSENLVVGQFHTDPLPLI
jgi:hypothetical protein